jgi:metal-sulfur cluster biosynthetic enzyme
MISEEAVLDALRQVLDPELQVNIVDLGLVYSAQVDDGRVQVALTLTTPACPLGAYVVDSAESAIWRQVPGVESVSIALVWSPPWRPAMMSDTAKDLMGWV